MKNLFALRKKCVNFFDVFIYSKYDFENNCFWIVFLVSFWYFWNMKMYWTEFSYFVSRFRSFQIGFTINLILLSSMKKSRNLIPTKAWFFRIHLEVLWHIFDKFDLFLYKKIPCIFRTVKILDLFSKSIYNTSTIISCILFPKICNVNFLSKLLVGVENSWQNFTCFRYFYEFQCHFYQFSNKQIGRFGYLNYLQQSNQGLRLLDKNRSNEKTREISFELTKCLKKFTTNQLHRNTHICQSSRLSYHHLSYFWFTIWRASSSSRLISKFHPNFSSGTTIQRITELFVTLTTGRVTECEKLSHPVTRSGPRVSYVIISTLRENIFM